MIIFAELVAAKADKRADIFSKNRSVTFRCFWSKLTENESSQFSAKLSLKICVKKSAILSDSFIQNDPHSVIAGMFNFFTADILIR